MTGFWSGTRYAARGLMRAPQFTIAAGLTLALAIGANASIFSVVQAVLLKPLPFRDSETLVTIRHTAPGLNYPDFGVSPGTYMVYRGHGQLFTGGGIYQAASVSLTGDDAPPERVGAVLASRGVLETLGTPPLMGRNFDEAEDLPAGPRAAILMHGLWKERFGGDPQVVGRTVRVNGEVRTIVGVMPESFAFGDGNTRILLPLALDTANANPGNFSFSAIARLAPGLNARIAEERLAPAMEQVRERFGGGTDNNFIAFIDAGRLAPMVKSLKEQVVGNVTRPLWILLGTVVFVFLIACANVANLFLVRAEARQKEMAVRAAMGAARRGLIGHYLAESALLAAIGGLIGLGLTWIGLRALIATAPPGIPRLDTVAIDPVVLLFTFGITALAAVLLGVLPTIRLTSPNLLATLSRSGRGSTVGRERHRTRQILVVAQTAMALVLLVGSGLMVRSFQRLRALDPGFDAENVLTFRVSLPEATYPEVAKVVSFEAQLLDRLRAMPGVEAVGATSHLALDGCCSGTAHVLEDRPPGPGELPPMAWYSSVTDGYFEAMGIDIVSGRSFTMADRDSSAAVIIVSQALARKYWPDSDPLGKRVRLSSDSTGWRTIVGVAASVRDRRLEDDPSEMVYYPAGYPIPFQSRGLTYVIRTARTDAVSALARQEVWALDRNLPVASTQTLEKVVAASVVRTSFTMLALVVAAVIALFLGAIGLYGVISYLVTQRTNEIGIRMALGARPGEVRRMVVLQGVRLSALGLVVGFAGALGLTRLMQGMLYGTAPTDPLTFGIVVTFLAAIALLASYLPARRASRIDPASSLKAE